jgi:hypothetical protein
VQVAQKGCLILDEECHRFFEARMPPSPYRLPKGEGNEVKLFFGRS